MARFVFKLEALLELRRREERDLQANVATIEVRRRELEGTIIGLQGELDSVKQDVRGALDPAIDTPAVELRAVRLQTSRSLHLRGKTQQLVLQLAGVHHRLEAARTLLRAASTRRRAVELLRERQYQRWLAEQNRREAIHLDELATMRFARRAEADLTLKDAAPADPIID
ncbi:MAG TPA: flagellar export protein FliJ [Phycisphaerales bacterium]|nr:flagellar export protein FliJ [Phycisphaerales bacterium]